MCFASLSFSQNWIQRANCPYFSGSPSFHFSIGTKIYAAKQDSIFAWEQTTNTWSFFGLFPGAARGSFAVATANGKAYVVSGALTYSTCTSEVWEFDSNFGTWTQRSNFPGTARYGHSLAYNSSNGKIYLSFGTYVNTTGYQLLSDFWEYDPVQDSWTQKTGYTHLNAGRHSHVSIEVQGNIWISSGSANNPISFVVNDQATYSVSTNTWTGSGVSSLGGWKNASVFMLNGVRYGGLGFSGGGNVNSQFGQLGTFGSFFPGGASCGNLYQVCNGRGYIGLGTDLLTPFNYLWEFNPGPGINVGTTANGNSICANGTITLFASGASSYTWQPGSLTGATVVVSPSVTTVYTVTGPGNLSSTIVVNAIPYSSVTVSSSTNAICAGTSVTLTASSLGGGNNFTWNNGVSNSSVIVVSPSTTTTYSVFQTGAPCSAKTTSIQVYPVPVLTVSPQQATLCPGGNVAVNVLGAASYTLLPLNTTFTSSTYSFFPNNNGIHTVVGQTSFGCSSFQTFSVNTLTPAVIGATQTNYTVCPGGTVTVVPTGGYAYTITPGFFPTYSQVTLSPTATAVYTVFGKSNLNSCIGTGTFHIQLSQVNLSVSATPPAICIGDTAVINVQGATTYTNIGYTTTIVSPTSSATYSIIGTNSLGCVSTMPSTLHLVVNPLPTATISGADQICENSTILLIANGTAQNYVWNNNSSNSSVLIESPSVTTVYSVVATDINNCSTLATKTVLVLAPPIISLSVLPSTTLCAGTQATLQAGGATYYQWSNGSFNSSILVSPNQPTTYAVLVTDNYGCTTTESVSIFVLPLPVVGVSSSSAFICAGESVTLTAFGAQTFTWNTQVQNTSIVMSPTLSTVYTVSGTATDGCINTATLTQLVDVCAGLSSVFNSTNNCAVYPNPFQGEIFIDSSMEAELIVINSLGKILISESIHVGRNKIDLSTAGSGLLLYKIINKDKTVTSTGRLIRN